MTLLERVHGQYVHARRVRVLGERIGKLIPDNCSVLDVGCGDGQLAHFIQTRRPQMQITGVEVLPRTDALIPTVEFDGLTLPFADRSFDIVLFVDVLHHTADPLILLREAARVARRSILLKDHLLEGFLAGPTLRWMDRVGNARHGVALPHNYWTRARWREAFANLGLTVDSWDERLALYPGPADWAFGRSLHFLAKLTPDEKLR
jgi:SAM-dependent methyltransferase